MAMFAALLVLGWEEHDVYHILSETSVTLPAYDGLHADEQLHELAHVWLKGEWSGWFRIEELQPVEVASDDLVYSTFTDEAGRPFTLPIAPVSDGVWVF